MPTRSRLRVASMRSRYAQSLYIKDPADRGKTGAKKVGRALDRLIRSEAGGTRGLRSRCRSRPAAVLGSNDALRPALSRRLRTHRATPAQGVNLAASDVAHLSGRPERAFFGNDGASSIAIRKKPLPDMEAERLVVFDKMHGSRTTAHSKTQMQVAEIAYVLITCHADGD